MALDGGSQRHLIHLIEPLELTKRLPFLLETNLKGPNQHCVAVTAGATFAIALLQRFGCATHGLSFFMLCFLACDSTIVLQFRALPLSSSMFRMFHAGSSGAATRGPITN